MKFPHSLKNLSPNKKEQSIGLPIDGPLMLKLGGSTRSFDINALKQHSMNTNPINIDNLQNHITRT